MRKTILIVKVSFILLILFLLIGCTIRHQGRLYDLETGDVILVKYWVRGNRAIVETVLPSGENCKGECVSGGEGSVSWGNIYSYYLLWLCKLFFCISIPLSQRGVMTMVCGKGIVLDCEYVVKSYAIQGHGICRDNKGKNYRLIF